MCQSFSCMVWDIIACRVNSVMKININCKNNQNYPDPDYNHYPNLNKYLLNILLKSYLLKISNILQYGTLA